MILSLGVEVRIDTDKLSPYMRDLAAEECRMTGFPVTEENIAWFAAELAAKEGEDYLHGIRIEMTP